MTNKIEIDEAVQKHANELGLIITADAEEYTDADINLGPYLLRHRFAGGRKDYYLVVPFGMTIEGIKSALDCYERESAGDPEAWNHHEDRGALTTYE